MKSTGAPVAWLWDLVLILSFSLHSQLNGVLFKCGIGKYIILLAAGTMKRGPDGRCVFHRRPTAIPREESSDLMDNTTVAENLAEIGTYSH